MATTPASSSIVLGNSNTDGATVTGSATFGSPTGSVSFYQCGPTVSPQAWKVLTVCAWADITPLGRPVEPEV